MHSLLPAENTQFFTSSLYSAHQAQVVQTVQLPRWNMFGFQGKWIDSGGFCFWLSSTTLDIFFQMVKIVNECERESQSCPTLCDCMDYTVHGVLQARILELVVFPFSKGSSQPRNQTHISCIAGRFFTSWATRGAQEYWTGSLSLLQRIFPTWESKQGLLHCRQILYQVSYEGSPGCLSPLYKMV